MEKFLIAIYIAGQFFLISIKVQAQQSTGVNNETPSLKAALDVNFLTGTPQGILVPRLPATDTTTLKAGITTSEKGLLFFDVTNNVYRFWNGSRWLEIASSRNDKVWALNGNELTPADTLAVGFAYLGTNNLRPLILATNGQERIRISRNGTVGIGMLPLPGVALAVKSRGTGSILSLQRSMSNAEIFSFAQDPFGLPLFSMLDDFGSPNIQFGFLGSYINSGNLGLGTSAPEQLLHLSKGTLLIDGETKSPASDPYGMIKFKSGSGENYAIFNNDNNNDLIFSFSDGADWYQNFKLTRSATVEAGGVDGDFGFGVDRYGDLFRINKVNYSWPANQADESSVLTNDGTGILKWEPFTPSTNFWSPSGTNIFNNNAGNVGIGTNNPLSRLYVTGTGATGIGVNAGAGLEAAFGLYSAGVVQWSVSKTTSNDFAIFRAGSGAELLISRTTGNIGLGVTPPLDKLHLGVGQNLRMDILAGATTGMVFANDLGRLFKANFLADSNQVLRSNGVFGQERWIGVGNNAYYRVLNGNVGIGTTTPTNRLTVLSNESSNYSALVVNNVTSGISGGALQVSSTGSRSIGNNAMLIENLVTKSGGSNSTKVGLRINSVGSWGPGTTNQPNVGLWVDVNGADNNYAAVFNTGNVGIQTTNPVAPLHIGTGNWDLKSMAHNGDLLLGNATNFIKFGVALGGGGAGQGYIGATNVLFLGTSQGAGTSASNDPTGYQTVTIGSGNVGIRRNSPTAQLHLGGTMAIEPQTVTTTPIIPSSSYVIINFSGGVATFSNGTTIGQILIVSKSSGTATSISSATNLRLSASPFLIGIGHTLFLIWNGNQWLEISRSINN